MESKKTLYKKSTVTTQFIKSQISSFVATLVDFGSLIFFVEIFNIHYVVATALSALLGAVTNFTLGRHWSFQAENDQIQSQIKRYILISAVSLVLNTLSVFLLTHYIHFAYPISKAIGSFLIGILFNFPMHKNYVFQSRSSNEFTSKH